MTVLGYEDIAARAAAALRHAQVQAEVRDADVDRARDAAERARGRVADMTFIGAFIARHPGLDRDGLLAAAEAEQREAGDDVARDQAEVASAVTEADRAAERVRDLEGYIRVSRQMAGEESAST
jgi:hypothetical protein